VTDDRRRGLETLHWAALVLTIIGAINWGLVGLFQFDLVGAIFGGVDGGASRVIYTLVGLAGLLLAFTEMRRETALRGGTEVPVHIVSR
jgi:uncharacterized membrane protein YuzA (DUF378 family)